MTTVHFDRSVARMVTCINVIPKIKLTFLKLLERTNSH